MGKTTGRPVETARRDVGFVRRSKRTFLRMVNAAGRLAEAERQGAAIPLALLPSKKILFSSVLFGVVT
jgi:hypothetical protein